MDKSETRQLYKEIRKNISERETKENAISDKLFGLFGNCRSIFCYQSFGSEVSTELIIKEYLSRGAAVYVPEVCGENMLLKNLASGEVTDTACELTIVPLLAFDDFCGRIGYGKGYYDRYLAGHGTTSVGIAFSEQYCNNLPKTALDVPLSYIITPDTIVKSGDL